MHRRSGHGTWRRGVGTLAVATLIGLTGCGGDDDADAEPAEAEPAEAEPADGADTAGDGDAGDDGGDAAESADDDGSGGTGGTADIGDFPIPAPDGLLLDALADAGISSEGQRQLFYPNDDVDRIVAFYDDWTARNGAWAKTVAQEVVLFQSLETDAIRTINVTPDQDPGAQADGPVTVVILVASE